MRRLLPCLICSRVDAVMCCLVRGTAGEFCQLIVPIRNNGDPHMNTCDGLAYDYFGVGLFQACAAQAADFGLQVHLRAACCHSARLFVCQCGV